MITTPFGKYEYNRVPMGFCITPDIFQEQKGSLMDDLNFVRIYFDDFLIITSGSSEENLANAKEVMKPLWR